MVYSNIWDVFSPSVSSYGLPERRIHAIRVPMDELPLDARDQRPEYYQDVGHISSTLISGFGYFDIHILQAEGPDAFSQFHLYVCSAFLVRWSEKLREMDFQVFI